MITKQEYIKSRLTNPKHKFGRTDIIDVHNLYVDNPSSHNYKHSILNKGLVPNAVLNDKTQSDEASILLWNEIMGSYYSVNKVSSIPDQARSYLSSSTSLGYDLEDRDLIRYITAFSSSSFLGIQDFRKSSFAMNSMTKTLQAHANPNISKKPWLIDNLEEVLNHISSHTSIMDRDYGDICLNAKMSSSSVKGAGSYRDFVLEHDLEDILTMMEDGIDHHMYAGTRSDRRGKYRLICSFHGAFRILDYLINNGSYALCSHGGVLSKYTTEGFNNNKMWQSLAVMSQRGYYDMVCLDYKGYDTQISLLEYVKLSRALNRHRMKDPQFHRMFKLYENWMLQPKPLGVKTSDGFEILIEYYRTLASGLHGTHSFENLIGISSYFESRNRGIRTDGFWSNGDDQNTKVLKSDIDRYIDFNNEYFNISWEKSLVSHYLTVWGKQWFGSNFHPIVEIGTFRSIWEKEGGNVDLIEESKFESNYCKILSVAIVLIRMGKSDDCVNQWIEYLCNRCDPKIRYDVIPRSLTNLRSLPTNSKPKSKTPKGLKSVEGYLRSKTFDLRMVNVHNYFDMLDSMYKKRSIFSQDIMDAAYYPLGTKLRIEMGFDYSYDSTVNIPYVMKKFYSDPRLSGERALVKTVLQSTKSFDGSVSGEFEFHDMISLAKAINSRNHVAWNRIIAKTGGSTYKQ